jgi:hypothetical protein
MMLGVHHAHLPEADMPCNDMRLTVCECMMVVLQGNSSLPVHQ